MNTNFINRITAVESYLQTKKSLRTIAQELGMSHITLWRWLRWYRQGGEENLNREKNFTPWNKLDSEIEKKVARLKENKPSLTICEARIILLKSKIKISSKCVWSIWKRYGLVPLKQKNEGGELAQLFPKPESILSPEIARIYELLNRFGEIPFPEYYQKARHLRSVLENKQLFYSAIRIGIAEGMALEWMSKPKEQVALLIHLKNFTAKMRDPLLKFHIYIGLGMAYARMLNLGQVHLLAQKCQRFVKSLNILSLWRELANLYAHIGRNHQALKIVTRLFEEKTGQLSKRDYQMLNADYSILLASSGDYSLCLKALKNIDKHWLPFSALPYLIRAQCALSRGMTYEATQLVQYALEMAKKGELLNTLHVASLIFAGCHIAFGERKKAYSIICGLNPLFGKNKMEKDLMVRKLLVSEFDKGVRFGKALAHPVCQMIVLLLRAKMTLKSSDYYRAFSYASKHKLLGLFHRFILFIPEPVIALIKKGKKAGLPRTLLRLPIFSEENAVYRINFLGPIQVFHKEFLKKKLSPKESAFLTFLALNQKPRIPLKQIYENFWHKSKKPSRNLSHLLVRIKNILKLPSQALYIGRDELHCACHIITDWHEFEEHISQAKALEKIDGWAMAEVEYQQAFFLFRGQPFVKMYDNFSEDKRLGIIFKFEDNARHFIDEWLKRHPDHTKEKFPQKFEKVLSKIAVISPHLLDSYVKNSTPVPNIHLHQNRICVSSKITDKS